MDHAVVSVADLERSLHGLGWNPDTLTGPVFQMVTAVAVAGRIGVTAIANSRSDADALYTKIESTLARAIASAG